MIKMETECKSKNKCMISLKIEDDLINYFMKSKFYFRQLSCKYKKDEKDYRNLEKK